MAEQPPIDIRADHWQIVRDILHRHVPHCEVWAFGSRVKWTAKPHSDLDLAIIADQPLPLAISAALADDFSESDLPWRVDVVDWATTSESFRQIIERDKVVVQKADRIGLQGGGMSSEWRVVSIGELADARPGSLAVGPFGSRMKADLYVPKGVRVIRGNNLGDGRRLKGDFVHVTAETADSLASCCLIPGDLVFPHRGNIGEVGITPDDGRRYMLSTSLMKLSPDRSKVDPLYLMYFFKSSTGRSALLMNASQVGTPGIATPLKSLRGIELPLPPLEVQRAITVILQTLDDRITLLRETNATLEAIAQALFKSWFVDFDPVRARLEGRTPEGMDEATAALFPDSFEETELGVVPRGWKLGSLGDVAQTARSQVQPDAMHSALHYVGLEHIPRKCLSLSDWGVAEGLESAKSCFVAGDILFGKLRPYFHKVVVAPMDGVCSTDILVCRSTKPAYYGFVVMQLFSDALVTYADRLSNGAKMPRVNWKDLAAYELVVPAQDVAEAFTTAVQPLLNRMAANVFEAQTLATLRDTLLPRLISGQLRLPEAQTLMDAVA